MNHRSLIYIISQVPYKMLTNDKPFPLTAYYKMTYGIIGTTIIKNNFYQRVALCNRICFLLSL